jgi:hypothetical protein
MSDDVKLHDSIHVAGERVRWVYTGLRLMGS